MSERRIGVEDEAESLEGVDRTLIRWMLSLTPAERLEVAQSAADSLCELRDAVTQD